MASIMDSPAWSRRVEAARSNGSPSFSSRHDGVEVSPERHVIADLPETGHGDGLVQRDRERRHVADRHAPWRHRRRAPRRRPRPDLPVRPAVPWSPGVHRQPCRSRPAPWPRRSCRARTSAGSPDTSMNSTPKSASGRVGGCRMAPRHGRVPARLVHQHGAQVVHVLQEVRAPLGHRRAGDHADAAGDDPGRHALGVRVDRVQNPLRTHRSDRHGPPSAWHTPWRGDRRILPSASGPRGGRHGPPYRPATSIASLIACTNSVLESQRSNGCSRRYAGTAAARSPASRPPHSAAHSPGSALGMPAIQPGAPRRRVPAPRRRSRR